MMVHLVRAVSIRCKENVTIHVTILPQIGKQHGRLNLFSYFLRVEKQAEGEHARTMGTRDAQWKLIEPI
jgi:hypothetical protein